MGRKKIVIDTAAVEEHAARGLAEYQIAEALGVDPSTLRRRKAEPGSGIAEALQRGRAAALGQVENAAYRCAMRAPDDPRYQVSLLFWLRCKAGWNDRPGRADEKNGAAAGAAAGAADRLAEALARRFAGDGDPAEDGAG